MVYRPIEKSFSVAYQYRLLFTKELFSPENALLASLLRDYPSAGPVGLLVVIDQGVADSHPGLARQIEAYAAGHSRDLDLRDIMIVSGGEEAKNSERYVEEVLQAIDHNHICRHSFVLVIGGGAVIDMAGYAAAIAHRGVKLIRVPTTVLSQNDAAVGVKNGINYFGKKNFIGSFAVPYAIINDADFLTTLENRDWIAGIAEGIKVALIRDADFFEFIDQHADRLRERDMDSMQELIYRCAELHMRHIAEGGDPFETGSSRPLDFGHWAAHRLEHLTGYVLRHGEAVAIGMALDVTYARIMGLLSKDDHTRIMTVLKRAGFDLQLPPASRVNTPDLIRGIQEFREHLGGRLTITLITGIGKKHDVHEIDLDKMHTAIAELRQTD